MYFAPQLRPDPKPSRLGDNMQAIGGPAPDTNEALKRDAPVAAQD